LSSKRFYLIILIISLSILTYAIKIPLYNENNFIGYLNTSLNDSTNKEIINGYWLDLNEINNELDYFVIGSLNSYDLIFDFSSDLGSFLKNKGYDFIVFGNMETLKKSSDNFLKYIASSPYIVSQVIYTMIRGFESSGIFPVIYLSKGYDKDIKNSLDQKGGKIYYLSDFDNQNYLFYDKINKKIQINDEITPRLAWEIPYDDSLNKIIKEIFNNSIIITGWIGKDYKIYYRKIPENSKEKSIVYFSKTVENRIKDFLNNKENIYTAKKNWDW
jgi:hypothetical protein